MGIDGAPGGWVGVVVDHKGFVAALFGETIGRLAELVPDADGFGIDIPIGLFADRFREADVVAREAAGPRRASIFPIPPRPALESATYAAGNELARRLTGSGMSVQAYGLRAKIFEVERWLPGAGVAAWEVHPEVSFATLAGRPLTAGKKTWNGSTARRNLLVGAGICLPDDLGIAGTAGVDDVLDAAVVAWSCRRLIAGRGRSWPDPPEPGPGGRPIAIWA